MNKQLQRHRVCKRNRMQPVFACKGEADIVPEADIVLLASLVGPAQLQLCALCECDRIGKQQGGHHIDLHSCRRIAATIRCAVLSAWWGAPLPDRLFMLTCTMPRVDPWLNPNLGPGLGL